MEKTKTTWIRWSHAFSLTIVSFTSFMIYEKKPLQHPSIKFVDTIINQSYAGDFEKIFLGVRGTFSEQRTTNAKHKDKPSRNVPEQWHKRPLRGREKRQRRRIFQMHYEPTMRQRSDLPDSRQRARKSLLVDRINIWWHGTFSSVKNELRFRYFLKGLLPFHAISYHYTVIP